MKLTYLLCLLAALVMCTNAFAETGNQGRRMHVQISNETGVDCKLIHQQLIHGKYDTLPPQAIMPHDAKWFDVEQVASLIGTEVQTTYQCGNKYISFETQQTSSFIFGHTPYVTIWDSNGLTIDSLGDSSSIFFNYPGTIYITLKSAG